MLKLKTKWFNKWAKKNALPDHALLETLEAVTNNLNAVNLGNGLYKVRTPTAGQGKSGGFRTLLVYKNMDRAIFVYGFAKSDQGSLGAKDLEYLKKLAKDLLQLREIELVRQIKLGHFFNLVETK